MIDKIKYYFSLVKFSHTVFALPFAVLSFFLAVKHYEYLFEWKILIYILLCMGFARNSAMAFNRYLDRDIDKSNPRTSQREIPANKISPRASLFFVVVNILLFVTTTYFINSLCFYLSPLAIFIILFYSYTKRFTSLSHIVLGLALSVAPAGAFIAVSETVSVSVLILSLMVLFWTAGFDIIYSLQDEVFDKKNKLFSIPAKYGRKKALVISRVLHLFCGTLCLLFGIMINGNYLYWIAFVIFSGLLIYQHSLVKPNDISKAGYAFQNVNGIISITFAVLTILSLFIQHS